MNAAAIIKLIPDNLLNELALDTGVNRYSKKLQGEVLFKLLIHCILSYKDNSLRTMESAYESMAFKILNDPGHESVKHSSISERLSVMKSTFFEKLYEKCIETFGNILNKDELNILRFDSTIVTHSSKLLEVGYKLRGDAQKHSQLKFTIGFSKIPESVDLYTKIKYTSENAALPESILSLEPIVPDAIRVFDQGITSRKTYDAFMENDIPFVTRINPTSKREIYQSNKLKTPIETESIQIVEDSMVYLFGEKGKKSKHPVRFIRVIQKTTQTELIFITNIDCYLANDITDIYKSRWDIEVFFKFLKQELNFSHLINRSENGIKIILYTTLIAACLILVFKKTNKLQGFKIPKLKFLNDLEKNMMRDFVIMTGGNLDRFEEIFSKSPT